ncbi:hypothetical protein [uncultured Gelidibacter sp.]|uniref:hypothetical protein n=1 Tax=uncultured Gelidibacter sp. TaxID=259318 RepID=UPI00263A2352|nr:hypothetical protein [uncultured Gelidibacter sp.]
MKTTLILLAVIFISNASYAQSEIETLEKMYNMVQNDREKEAKAKELVWSYYSQTKEKVRKESGKLTQDEYDSLNNYQSRNWNQITNAIRDNFRNNYSKFYSQKKQFLEDYREDVLDKLYKYIYN